MSYQVIARKWRPQSFGELVGQNHISQTLGNALKNGRVPHALLFTGPRGTGKTSSARILAKSLRCPHAINFVPCNVCSECLDITQGRAVDVIEIDGASNNGVDAIRELRDTVGYMPSSGHYKIYIIDEVHMLSTSAFNALLKTLEEPPDHVIFIMATTEVHKIPQTILSRCQRFDFRRITTRQITDRLKYICEKDGVSATDDALWLIARQGDGSMRDSQSLLDQVITFANGPLTRENVTEILGLTDRALILETLSALMDRDTSAVLKVLRKFHSAGYEAHLFSQELLENLRHILLLRLTGHEDSQLVELPDSEIRFLIELGKNSTEEEVHFLFDMCLKGAQEIPRAPEPRIVLEMLLMRMACAPKIHSLSKLLQGEIQVLTEKKSENLGQKPSSQESTETLAEHHVHVDPHLPDTEKWLAFTQWMKKKDSLFAAKVENLLFVELTDKKFLLAVPVRLQFLKDQVNTPDLRKKLQSFIDQFWGPGYSFEIKLGTDQCLGSAVSAQQMVQTKLQQKNEEIRQHIETHPMIQTAKTVFKGQIKSIKETS